MSHRVIRVKNFTYGNNNGLALVLTLCRCQSPVLFDLFITNAKSNDDCSGCCNSYNYIYNHPSHVNLICCIHLLSFLASQCEYSVLDTPPFFEHAPLTPPECEYFPSL